MANCEIVFLHLYKDGYGMRDPLVDSDCSASISVHLVPHVELRRETYVIAPGPTRTTLKVRGYVVLVRDKVMKEEYT